MIGGDAEGGKLIEPILKDLAVPGGYVHAGKAGAGHYVNWCIMELNLVCCRPLAKA